MPNKKYLYVHCQWTFDSWPLDLVKSNIPVLHSLITEGWQNFTWNSIILFKNLFFSKHQKKVVLAISLLIPKIKVVLKTSVTLMTSTDMKTSLAFMTSTASLSSKNQKLLALDTLSDFPGIRNLSSLNDLNSLISSKNYWVWCFHQPWHQNDLSCSLNVGWIIKNWLFYWLLAILQNWGCGG